MERLGSGSPSALSVRPFSKMGGRNFVMVVVVVLRGAPVSIGSCKVWQRIAMAGGGWQKDKFGRGVVFSCDEAGGLAA